MTMLERVSAVNTIRELNLYYCFSGHDRKGNYSKLTNVYVEICAQVSRSRGVTAANSVQQKHWNTRRWRKCRKEKNCEENLPRHLW